MEILIRDGSGSDSAEWMAEERDITERSIHHIGQSIAEWSR